MAMKKQDRFVIKENQGLGAGMLYVVVDMQTGVNYLAVGGLTPTHITPLLGLTPTHITPLLDANGNVVVDSAAQNTLE